MSKKHFIKLAAVLREQIQLAGKSRVARATLKHTAIAIASLCSSFNPRFNRERFLRASGIEE